MQLAGRLGALCAHLALWLVLARAVPRFNQPSKPGLAPHERPSCQLTAALQPHRANLKPAGSQQHQQHQQQPSWEPSSPRPLDSSERLGQLRQLLASNGYDAYLVTPNDEHNTEYVSDYDRRLRFITGFSGSNGFALVLAERAVLFTDGRYALQAERELDCNWSLVVGDEPLADVHLWLRASSIRSIKLASDARLMSLQSFDYLDTELRKLDSELVLISQDLVDAVWSNFQAEAERPAPLGELCVHPLEFAGNLSWQQKVGRLASAMSQLGDARHYVIGQLDDVAWLLNLRGSDVPMTPLFKAYVFVSRLEPGPAALTAGPGALAGRASDLQAPPVLTVPPSNQTVKLTLYVDLRKVGPKVREHLHLAAAPGGGGGGAVGGQPAPAATSGASGATGAPTGAPGQQQQAAPSLSALSSTSGSPARVQVELKDYNVFVMDVRDKLTGNRQPIRGRLLLEAQANVAVHVLAKNYDDRLVLSEGLVSKLKAVKTEAEVEGMRAAHYRDSLAICMLLSQLEADLASDGHTGPPGPRWTETSAADELRLYRALMELNRGQSFETISAYGANAAVVHYRPTGEVALANESTYLLDSGGQYLDGTTDITRTLHFGRPSEAERDAYTRVLMGAIDMMSLVFEQPTRSPYRLNDLLARRHLLEAGLDYAHGTGHGIGLYSLVHEAPALIEHYASSASIKHHNGASAGPGLRSGQLHSEPVLLQPNMFSSVEPGFYKAGAFGIRLENIVVTQRASVGPAANGSSPANPERLLLRFEPLSVVPFEPKLIKAELLSNKQKAWLNSYNLMVRLRITQQINHYLARLRRGPSSAAAAAATAPSTQAGRQPPLATPLAGAEASKLELMEPEVLQAKLERTHKWVMAKTQLLALDVPRALAEGPAPAAGSADPALDGQRLMLAYMSAAPFSDGDAAAAWASIDAQTARQQGARPRHALLGRADEPPAAPRPAAACASQLQCDLALLRALNASSGAPAGRAEWAPLTSLFELDELAGFGRQRSSAGWWPYLSLCAFPLGALASLGLVRRRRKRHQRRHHCAALQCQRGGAATIGRAAGPAASGATAAAGPSVRRPLSAELASSAA